MRLGFVKFANLARKNSVGSISIGIGSNAGFRIWTNKLLNWEGGYGNRPYYEDQGGETNKGVTWVAYKELAKDAGLNPSYNSFRNLSDSGAIAIAKVFWNRYGGIISYDPIAIQIVYAHWGSLVFGMNMTKYLQRLLGVSADGVVGNKTTSAINKLSDSTKQKIADKLLTYRWNYLKSLPNAQYNPGWFGKAFTDLKEMVSSNKKTTGGLGILLILGIILMIKK